MGGLTWTISIEDTEEAVVDVDGAVAGEIHRSNFKKRDGITVEAVSLGGKDVVSVRAWKRGALSSRLWKY